MKKKKRPLTKAQKAFAEFALAAAMVSFEKAPTRVQCENTLRDIRTLYNAQFLTDAQYQSFCNTIKDYYVINGWEQPEF